MPDIPDGPLGGPTAWRGDSLAAHDGWIRTLPEEVISEVEAALTQAKARGLQSTQFGMADFPLPSFAAEADRIRAECEGGLGFILVRGLPMDRYSKEDAAIVFWALGCHVGPIITQTDGLFLGHVRDLGLDIDDPTVRFYQTTGRAEFHNDHADVISMMCLRQAKMGGSTGLISAVTVHDIMQRERPDLLRELFEPYIVDRRGETGRPEEESDVYFLVPVLGFHKGLLTIRMLPMDYYKSSERHPDIPRHSQAQYDALDMFWEVCHRPGVAHDVPMEPGDVVFICNYSVLHAREAYRDWHEPDRKRHLLRLWMCISNSRELPPAWEPTHGTIEAGAVRSGFQPVPARR